MAIDSTKVHQHLQSISRINTGLAVASLIGVLLLFAWFKWNGPADQPTTTNQNQASSPAPTAQPAIPIDSVDQAELNQDYRSAVNGLLDGYTFADAAQAETLSFQLIELMVPAEFKSLQLELVIALDEASNGKSEEARARIERVRQQHSWLLPNFAG